MAFISIELVNINLEVCLQFVVLQAHVEWTREVGSYKSIVQLQLIFKAFKAWSKNKSMQTDLNQNKQYQIDVQLTILTSLRKSSENDSLHFLNKETLSFWSHFLETETLHFRKKIYLYEVGPNFTSILSPSISLTILILW